MKDLVFTSVAFGPEYVAQQDRLKESILKIYPDANIMFWRDELPPRSKPFLDSLYGFKIHAIAEAKKTYSKVLWLDPAMILMRDCEAVLCGLPFVAVKDDNLLANNISDKCMAFTMVNKRDLQTDKINLVGGSLYYFNFLFQPVQHLFDDWFFLEHEGLFGSQKEAASEQINSHRNDESCLALCMYRQGIKPIDAYKIFYCVENNSVFSKKHFK